MLKVGIAGLGFMGWIHWLAYQKIEGIEVAAICTPESHRLAGDWTDIQGNFGPVGEKVDLSGIATYSHLDQLLADQTIDLIDICLPPALHSRAIEQAAAAGKHVFCEKPLALNLADCDRAITACRKNERLLMVGHVLPFFVEYQFLREQIASGKYGKLLGGSFKRVVSDPKWLKHFFDPNIIGGPLFDLHVHDAHIIRLLFGMPVGVNSCGRVRGEVVEYWNSIFEFEDPSLAVTCTSGVINQDGRPFTHGFEVHLERATIQFEFAALASPHEPESSPVKVFAEHGEVHFPDLGDNDPILAFQREIREVARCLQAGEASSILSGAMAREAIEICEMQAQQVLHGGAQIAKTIRERQTWKVLGDINEPIAFPESTIENCNAMVKRAIGHAGWAPFHYDRGVDGVAEPWRVHFLGVETCRHLAREFPNWVDDLKPSNKLPAMLSACGAVVLVTWLPQFRGEALSTDGELPPAKKCQVDDEHLCATAAMIQNLLLLLTADGSGNLLVQRRATWFGEDFWGTWHSRTGTIGGSDFCRIPEWQRSHCRAAGRKESRRAAQ